MPVDQIQKNSSRAETLELRSSFSDGLLAPTSWNIYISVGAETTDELTILSTSTDRYSD